jgi:hypothetical protein
MTHCGRCGAALVEYHREHYKFDSLTGVPTYRVFNRCPNAIAPEWLGRLSEMLRNLIGDRHTWEDHIDRRDASDAWQAAWQASFTKHRAATEASDPPA